MGSVINDSFLNQVVETMTKNRSVHGAVLCVENGENTLSWLGGAGNLHPDDQYFIMSVTKLCVTAIVMQLVSERRLLLDDKICKYLPEAMLMGLHVLKGVDHSKEITIAHLLSNTSGIPDYLSFRQESGKSADSGLNAGNDEPWPLDKVIGAVKTLKPKFPPGKKGKASYSNTNFRLLGVILENIIGKDIGVVFKEYIINELNLANTYVFQDLNDSTPAPMYFKNQHLHIPQCMASATAEGGIISTAKDTMAILKAFFNGHFFPKEGLKALKKWNFVFFPFQAYLGMGLEKVWLPRILSPHKPINELVGFWGSSGAFAFYNPDTDLYFTGTVNQANGFGHSAAFNGMLKIIKSS